LEIVREKAKRVEAKREAIEKREKLLLTESKLLLAERDPQRLLWDTKAFESNKVSVIDLDAAHTRRVTGGAHTRNIAMGGYDLKFKGRATPAWCKAAGGLF
jgi:hypothetical protein